MGWWRRLGNTVRGNRLNPEIEEELASHLEEAAAMGRDPREAQRAFGSRLGLRERTRDEKVVPWLESLIRDAGFGWRQVVKKKVTAAAVVVSLGLAIGACASAFRIIDALLLRPLPVAGPDRLYALSNESTGSAGQPRTIDTYEYPLFRQMREAVKGRAELIAVSTARPVDLSYGAENETEKAYLQHVSGWMFPAFGLRPVQGRLLTEDDDRAAGAHPYAVISEDYWTRRFARDSSVIGKTLRMGTTVYTIVGVCAGPFTGTDPGTVTDFFLPTTMSPTAKTFAGWLRVFVHVKPESAPSAILDSLRGPFRSFREEQARGAVGMSRERITRFLNEQLSMTPAAAGVSSLQREYRTALIAIGALVGLVLLIACANVANLMTAQTSARTREMALRMSIGAGRARLVRMVLLESAWLALLASAAGALLAWWAAPAMVSSVEYFPGHAVRLVLPTDWRAAGFSAALGSLVLLLFGMAPALRASAVQPVAALRGDDPHFRGRLMRSLVGLQTAFCVLVLFVAGLFVATFERLTREPTGFSAERIVTLDASAMRAQPPAIWDQAADRLRQLPGVEKVALADWALMNGSVAVWSIALDGGTPLATRAYFLNVSPGWLETMKIPLMDGRDFHAGEAYPQAAIVNETFAKTFFAGENPVGRQFEQTEGRMGRVRLRIVGLVRDARYVEPRGPMLPVVYVPFPSIDSKGALQPRRAATIVVRTTPGNTTSIAPLLRREITRARPELRVSDVLTQTQIVEWHTIRERLLARLALFFGGIALLLAGVGLYGVLDYSVLQRRREIGIRMAIGAQARDIAKRVTGEALAMVMAGVAVGIGAGMAAARYIESLLYGVRATDVRMLAIPCVAIVAAAILSAVPAVVRAVRVDPVGALRE